MEEQLKVKKNIYFDKMIEDLPTLYQKKYKLIKEKNDLSKVSEISRLKSTDNLKLFTSWDVMLMQIKHLALDFHEERKWKKGILYNLIHKAAQKYKKNKTKEKINELYKKSCCLYLAMCLNFNIKEICNGKNNSKMNESLNRLIKETMSSNDLRIDILKKKERVEKLKNKVEKVFGDKFKNAESLLKIFKQMENIIKQNERNVENPIISMNIDSVTGKEFPEFQQKNIDNEIGRINKIYEKIDRSNTDVNLNIINNELNNLLQELEEYSLRNNNVEVNFPSEENDIFSNEIKLFYENPNETDQLKTFISEKLPKSNVIFLPNSDEHTLPIKNYIENEDTNNFEKNFEKYFPSIVRYSEKNDVIMYEEVKKKETKFPSSNSNNQFDLIKMTSNNKISIVQKCVYLWGLARYGLSLSILYDLPNIFPFSKSIYFEKEEELLNYLNEMLKEFDVELESSSFENLSLYKDSLLFNIKGDSPLLNCNECSFDYNSKLYQCLMKKQFQKDFPIYVINKPYNIPLKTQVDQGSNRQISFYIDNKIIKNNKDKEKIQNQLKNHLFEVSNTVYSNYRIFTHKEKDIKFSSKSSVSNSLSQNQLDYMTNKIDFSIDNLASKILEKTKPVKNSLVEGIAFYSPASIQREWETLRSPWYQNNFQCKPKFRKYIKYGNSGVTNQNAMMINSSYSNSQSMITRNFSDSNMRNIN